MTIRRFIAIIGALVVIGAAGYALAMTYIVPQQQEPVEVAIGEQTYQVEVARTQEEKETGLSSKESLNDNQGMLFVFEKPGFYSFWMKKMNFPIDIIYIKDDKIVTIYKNVQPPENENQSLSILQPTEAADKVLEIKAGLAEKYNYKKNDTVIYENLSS